MAQALSDMMSIARDRDLIVERTLENNLRMFVYPLPLQGFLIGVGYGNDCAQDVSAAAVLRRRAEEIDRYGKWLPALFEDGSWYLIQRMESDSPGASGEELSMEDFYAPKELLS